MEDQFDKKKKEGNYIKPARRRMSEANNMFNR